MRIDYAVDGSQFVADEVYCVVVAVGFKPDGDVPVAENVVGAIEVDAFDWV